MAKLLRLDKYLADMQCGTRTEIKEAARKGRITVNGSIEKKADRKIDIENDSITMDGMPIVYAQTEYYMLNKPQGVVSATEDRHYKTVIDLITDAKRKDLFPVVRLDIDTEGLLVITNDGKLAHDLLSPKKHVDKVYFAKIEGILPTDVVEQFKNGLDIGENIITAPAELVIEKKDTNYAEIKLTIHEGKFHQVKRMFEAVDCHVVYLKRMSMGALSLDPSLELGSYRALTEEEVKQLKECNENE